MIQCTAWELPHRNTHSAYCVVRLRQSGTSLARGTCCHENGHENPCQLSTSVFNTFVHISFILLITWARKNLSFSAICKCISILHVWPDKLLTNTCGVTTKRYVNGKTIEKSSDGRKSSRRREQGLLKRKEAKKGKDDLKTRTRKVERTDMTNTWTWSAMMTETTKMVDIWQRSTFQIAKKLWLRISASVFKVKIKCILDTLI